MTVGANVIFRGVYSGPAITNNASAGLAGAFFLFQAGAALTSTSSGNPPYQPFVFINNSVVQYNVAGGTATLVSARAFDDAMTVDNLLAGGTFTVSDLVTLVSRVSVKETAGTTNVTARTGFRHDAITVTGSPAITTDVAVNIADTKITQVTNAQSIVSAGALVEMRHGGPGVFGANAVPTNASVALEVQSTTRAFVPSRMTTTQRDAIVTIIDGMLIYNSTTGTFQGRAAGAWVNL